MSEGPSKSAAGGGMVVVVYVELDVVDGWTAVVGDPGGRVVGGMVTPGWGRRSMVVVGAGLVVTVTGARAVVVVARGRGAVVVGSAVENVRRTPGR